MDKPLNLFDLLQNTTIGVIALHSFILGYNNVAKHKNEKENYPPLVFLFYVLPIVYDLKSLEAIKFELYTTITENKALSLGLQEKANKMSEQTFDSLNLGLNKQIFEINTDNFTVSISSNYEKEILSYIKINNDYLKKLVIHSKRLGNIFAKKDEKMLQLELNIRF